MAEKINRKSALLENEEMDWSINYNFKLICAIIFGAVSLILWIGYSTPNTINVGILWMGEVTLNLVLFALSGSFIGWIFGLSLSFLEYASMLAWLWKKRWYFVLTLFICMGTSIYASYIFNTFSEQSNIRKEDKINAHDNLVDNFRNLIAIQDSTIAGRRQYINSTLPQLRFKYRQQGYEPNWIAMRERQALEAIERATYLKQVYSDSLTKYTFKSMNIRDKTSYIVRLSKKENTKKSSLIVASIIEFLIVFCGFVSIGFFNSVIQDSNRGIRKGKTYVIDKRGKLRRKETAKKNRKEYVKDINVGKSITKIFAGKDNGNGTVKSNNENDSLRKEVVKAWLAQLGEVEQGVREKTNMTEIANDLGCERQNVHYHLKQENLI